jgi:cupin 2 domain-containing protein
MSHRVENFWSNLPRNLGEEQILTLFQNKAVKIERIVSDNNSSPRDFWYDQPDAEWVIVLRGYAVLEFEAGELVQMKEGDWLTIPSHVKHRVAHTAAPTVWLAVQIQDDSR